MKRIHFGTRKEWRAWLEKNHDKEKIVCVINYKKHTGKPSMKPQEAMDEAICFGWIDTIVKRHDDDRYLRFFAKRNENSKWSYNTLKYGKRLIKEGLMSPHGLKMYKEGLKKKPHDYGIPNNPKMIKELQQALNKDKKANEYFNKMSPSSKKIALRWILRGKREETKMKRINIVVKKANQGKDLF